MWKVTVVEYNRYAGDSYDYDVKFSSREEAIEYCDTVNQCNCTVWLEELVPIGDDEYIDGDKVCLKSIPCEFYE